MTFEEDLRSLTVDVDLEENGVLRRQELHPSRDDGFEKRGRADLSLGLAVRV